MSSRHGLISHNTTIEREVQIGDNACIAARTHLTLACLLEGEVGMGAGAVVTRRLSAYLQRDLEPGD